MQSPTFIKQNRLLIIFTVIAAMTLIGVSAAKNQQKNSADGETDSVKTVSMIPVRDYLKDRSVTFDTGTVESLHQAELRSQFSGPVTKINAALGGQVSAGQVIVALKNDDLLAQLEQAKAGLAAAKAGLASAQKGARPEDLKISQTSTELARIGLATAVQDAYSKTDDAVRNHVNKFFTDPSSNFPRFSITINSGPDHVTFGAVGSETARNVEAQRVILEKKLDDWQKSLETINEPGGLENGLATAKENLNFTIKFMNDLSLLVNSLAADNAAHKQIVDGYKTELSAARAAVSGTLTGVLGAETSWKMALDAYGLKNAGATAEQLLQLQAGVDQAAAAVSALQAQVEKTYVRSPINGKISGLSARIGELASPGQLIATVVNPAALQVKTYASENDLPSIRVGDAVEIQGSAKGAVYKISPAIDPQTKKAEIIIAIDSTGGENPIVIGQTVNIRIEGRPSAEGAPVYLLPIQAVKSNSENFIFSVSQSGVVEATPVKTGNIIGERIEVAGDIDPGLKIISSVLGVAPGEKVNIE